MPELFSQVLDLKEKDVFLETEVNDTRYFSVTGIPSTLSYGKHPFSITFNDPEGQPLLKNLSNIVFEFVDSRGTVIFSDLLDIDSLSGAGNGVLWIKKDPLRTAAEISDGPVYLYVMGELDGDEIPEQWKGIYNVRSTFVFDARKDYPNISDLVLKNPLEIQTNLNISESIEFDTASSIFKRSFINVSLTNLDTDGGKIESVELAYNEQKAKTDEYEVITRYPLTSGSYEVTDNTKISGLNPITNTTKIITPKQFRRNTSVRFRLRFVNPAGQLAQHLEEDRQGEIVEVTSSFITFEGSPFFLERFDNLLRGSMFTGNAVGKGFEQSGKNSAFLKTVDYEGFISASAGSGSAGILFYSGSVLTSSGDNYNGVGLELHGGQGQGSFRFSTSPNLLEIQADTFFVGSETSQFISGSGGNIEISSSGYHLTPQGTVTASAILLGDKSAGQFLQFVDDTLTVQGSITADSIRTPASIGGAPSTDQNASSSISAGGFATFKSASIGGFVISSTDISSSGLVLKSSGQMTGSTTLIGDKGAGQFLQFAGSSLTVQGDITANSIRTPSSIGGSPSTISNASSSIDSQGFALFKSASIGGFTVDDTEISASGLVFKSGGQMTGSATLIGNKGGGHFLQFIDDTLTVQGDITANNIRTPATIAGASSTDANASASITSQGFAKFVSASIGGFDVGTGGISIEGNNINLDSTNKVISINDPTFGNTGIQLDFNSGTPRAFIGKLNGEFFKFDGSNIQVSSSDFFLGSSTQFVSGSNGNIEISSSGFHLDRDGNATLSGSIRANDGNIGDFQIIDGKISGSNITFDANNSTIFKTDQGPGSDTSAAFDHLRNEYYIDFTPTVESPDNFFVKFGPNFMVDKEGVLIASGARFEGTVSASAGFLGGFIINSSSISSKDNNVFISGSPASDDFFIKSPNFNVKGDGDVTGSQVLFTGGKIAGFDISGTKLQQGTSFHLDGNQNASFFISSSNFQVTPDGELTASKATFDGNTIIGGTLTVNGTGEIAGFGLTETAISSSNDNLILKSNGQITGSSVLFSGGKIADFTISSTEIRDSDGDLILKSNGQITASAANIIGKVTSTAGAIGGFELEDDKIKSSNSAIEINSALAGLFIKDGGGTDRVLVKSGSLGTVGGGTQYIGNKSFEDDSISAGRNFVSNITSWSFVEGGGTNISLTDRSGFPDEDKAVSGDVTLDVVVSAGSGNYSSTNTYELVQVITASIAQGDTLSFSSVGRFSSSFGGRGKDRALGPQYFRLEYSSSTSDGFVPFLPQSEFTASNGYGEYFLGSGQYSSFGASADLPESAEFIKVVLTGSINDDTGFSIEKPLFAGDKGTVNSALKGRKFRKQVKGSTTAEFPETEITFDNFSVRSNTRRVELTEDGLLIYNSEDSFFKMSGAGIELRGGSGVATFGSAINRESFTNDSQVAGTLGAPALQPYQADPENIGQTPSDGNVAEFAKGNHVHRITGATINTALSGITLDGSIFDNTFGSTAGAIISGSVTSLSQSLAQRITDEENDFTAEGISGSLGTNASLIRSLTSVGISGSFQPASSSFSTRITTEEGNIDTLQARNINSGDGLTGGGNLTSDRTLAVGEGTGISVGGTTVSTNDSEIVHDNLSGFVANEHIDHSSVSITAGNGLTGGGDITSTRTINVVGGTGITANSNDIEIDFSDATFQSNISGSFTDLSASLASRITDEENDFTAAGISGSLGSNATLIRSLTAAGISGSFTDVSSSFADRITTEEGNIDTLQSRNLTAGTGLTGGGTLSADRTFSVDFSDATLQTNISGSLGSNASLIRSLTSAGITGSFTQSSSSFSTRVTDLEDASGSFSTRVTTLEQLDTDDDLTVAGDTGGNLSIDMDTETLTIAGGTGIDTSGDTNTITVTTNDSEIVHDNLSGFVANEHIDHSTVSVIAGDGLTGGGTIAANRTLNIGAGTGIDVAADAISVDVSDFMTNGSDNRIVTATGTDAMNAEANLTFDGTTLSGTSATASLGRVESNGVFVTGSNIEMHSDTDTKLRIRRNQHATAAIELSFRGSTGGLIHATQKELDISTGEAGTGISLLPASGIVSINDSSSQGVNPGALSIQKISGINYLAIADAANSGAEGNIFLITGSNGNVGIANQDPQEKLDVTGNIQASGNISGSSTSTGSFGAIGIGTAPDDYKLNVEGTVRISGLSFFHNVNNPQYIWNSGNLTFRHGSPGSSNVILKLRSTQLESALEHHFDDKIVVSGDITGSGNLEIDGNISGSAQSTGSFGSVSTDKITLGHGDGPFLTEGENNILKIDSGDGTLELGARNSSYAHIQTDRSLGTYFAQPINSAGGLKLPTVGSLSSGLVFGDGNTGFFENSDNILYVTTAGSNRWQFNGGSFMSLQSGGPALYGETASSTNPTLIPHIDDGNTGIGRASADNLSLIAGGAEILRLASNTISGSSTSTGSFGEVHTEGVKGLAGDYSSVLLVPDTLQFGNDTDSMLRRRTSNNVEFRLAGTDIVRIDTTGLQVENGSLEVESGNVIASGNISGSSSSTGSFGQLDVARNAVVDNKLLVNTTNDARSHVIIADGTIGGPTFSGTFVDARSGHLKLGGNNSVTVLKDLLPGYDYTTVNAVDIGSTSARFNDIHFGGDISGSSTTTGSFGKILQNGQEIAIGQSVGTTDDVTFGSVTINGTSPVLSFDDTNENGEARISGNTGHVSIQADYNNVAPGSRIDFEVDGTHQARLYGPTGDLTLFEGGLVTAGNISGSSTSTGSFGHLNIAGAGNNVANFQSGNRTLSLKLNDSPPTGDVGVQFRAGASDYLGLAAGGGSGIGIVVDDSNNVGIRTISPGYPLDIASTAHNQDLLRLSHYTAPTQAGFMIGFNTDGSTDSNVITMGVEYSSVDYDVINIQRSTRNVGIGTTNPDSNLHVNSDGTVEGVAIKIEAPASNDYVVTFYEKADTLYWSTGMSQLNTNYNIWSEVINQPIVSVANNGSAVEFPYANTKISGSSTSTGSFGNIRVGDRTASENRFMSFAGDEGFKIGYAQTGFINENTSDAEIVMTGTGGSAPFNNHGSIVYKTRTVDLIQRSSHIFYTGNPSAERVRIDHDGNLGIGIASPGNKLHVQGDLIRVVNASYAGVESHNSNGTWESFVGTENGGGGNRYNAASSVHTFYNNSSAVVRINSSGLEAITGNISGSATSTGSFGKIDFRGTGEKVFLKYNHGSNANLNVGLKHSDAGSGGQFIIAGGHALTNRIATFQHYNSKPRIGIGVDNVTNTVLAISAPEADNVQLDVSSNALRYWGLGFDNSGAHRYLLGARYSANTSRLSITMGGFTTASDKITIYNSSGTHYVGINKGATNPAHSLDVSGSIVFANGTQAVQISGSAQSTGSFGTIQSTTATIPTLLGNTTVDATPNANFTIKDTGSNPIRLQLNNAGSTSNFQALEFLDSSGTEGYIRYTHGDDEMTFAGKGTAGVMLTLDSSGNAIFAGSKISGSATSTGSFGHGHFASQLGVGTTSPSSNLIHGTGDKPTTLRLDNTSSALNYILLKNSTSANNYIQTNAQSIQLNADANGSGGIVDLMTNNTLRLRIDSSGHATPGADNTYNLGSSSKRWADVFAVQTTTGGVFETGLRTEKIGDNPTGTIVSWRGDGLVPCDSNEDELVMGVLKEGKDEPIVMGAEPVLVTGKVEVGDYIVTSDKIGHGKSVKRGYLLKKDLFGKVIAQALEPSDDSDSCLIKCMIRKM